MSVFRDARLKIDRANHHIRNIETRIAELHKTDTSRVDIDSQTGGEILTHEFSDVTAFDDIALIIGDAVHNLNCALDYTWLQILQKQIPALVDDRAKFPVHKTLQELEGSMTKAGIDKTAPNLFRLMLDEIKPCDGGNDAIWPVHCLDIRDKHRLLIPILATGHIEGITVIDENGKSSSVSGVSRGFQRPPYIIDFSRGLHVQKNGKLTAQIIVEDGKSGYLLHAPETLEIYSSFIGGVIERFDDFLS